MAFTVWIGKPVTEATKTAVRNNDGVLVPAKHEIQTAYVECTCGWFDKTFAYQAHRFAIGHANLHRYRGAVVQIKPL